MSFNFFSLDYIYYPVSGIMWVWHKVFGSFLGAGSAITWVLSVVFLIFTLRAILFKPFMKQMDSQLKMQAVQPKMKALREKYKDDRQRLTEEMMKLNKEAGVNPLASCLPMLIQAPVFIGLFHVLRMFQPVNDGPEGPAKWFYRANVYFFGSADVESMGNAKLPGGAPLVGYMTMPLDQLTFMDGVREAIIVWGIPLTILAGIATHLTSRRSVARQREMNINADNPQTAIMNKLMLYLFPLFVVVGGPFFPLAILFYWLANNSWTFGQLWVAHRIQDKRNLQAASVVEEAKEASRFSTPKPGAKPKQSPGRPVVQPTVLNGTPIDDATTSTNGDDTTGSATIDGRTDGSTARPVSGGRATGSRPAPGARPPGQQNRKKKKSGRR